MNQRTLILTAVLAAAAPPSCFAQAESMWARRDPKTAYLFYDYRARQVGDLLTIVVSESTEIDNQESRELNKQTQTNFAPVVRAQMLPRQLQMQEPRFQLRSRQMVFQALGRPAQTQISRHALLYFKQTR